MFIKLTFPRCLFLFLFILSSSLTQAITLQLKPGATAGKDAYLASGTPSTNFSTHVEFSSTAWTCGLSPCDGRGIISFDLSSIPQNAIITNATLSLYANPNPQNGNGIAMQGSNASLLQRVLVNWNESTVTWANAPTTTIQNQVTIPTSTSSFQNYPNINVKNLVQDMVSNPSSSFGFLLRHVDETHYKSMIFASSDYPDSTKWPQITIEYEVLSTQPLVRSSFCPGSSTTVNYNSSSTFNAGNIFTAQLSDNLGSFTSPVNIGTLSSTLSGSIPVTFPANTPFGGAYRVRVVSSSPAIIGTNNGSNISFLNPNDNNVCTIDGCDPATGLPTHTNINFSDNNLCTNDLCDPVTGVYHTPVDPNDFNPCTIDACDPAFGPLHFPIPVVADGNLCTNDLCDPSTGNPIYTPVNVDDNNACTNDACNPVSGNISHQMINTNDQNLCTFDGCDYLTGVYHIQINSDDGNQCTIDACAPSTGLISHVQVVIDDQNACTIDGCNNLTGVYHNAVIVDDNNACTNDACDQVSGNISHIVLSTNDNNACTFDGCDFITGVFHNMVNSDDGNRCTNDICDPLNGNISHVSILTNDQNECTIDGCDNLNGVFHTPVVTDDLNACTIDACNSITGIVTHTLVNADDNNACTFDGCDFITGVFHYAPSIDDQNPCTNDACDPITGQISHPAVDVDDQNSCTTDGCNYNLGVYHNPINIDDANVCTIDACDISTGAITHTPVNSNDNNLCTDDGCDPLTGIYNNTISSDDFNSCTEDGCDPLTGVYHYDHSPIPVVNYDRIKCYGDQTCVTISAVGGQPPYSGTGLFCNYTAGDYITTISDATGCVVSQYLHIVQPEKLNVTVNTTASSCGNSNGSVEAIVIGGTTPYSYLWTPGFDSTAFVSGLSAGNYSILVTDSNNCTTNTSTTVGVNGNPPSMPLAITGPSGACRNQTGVVYSVASIPGASSYVWTLPSGASGASNTNSITVSFSNSYSGGFICVTASNGCGTSQPSCKNVLRITAKPGSIAQMSGPAKVCVPSVVTYCIPSVTNATNYIWSIGGNGGNSPLTIISGQGTTCVVVNVPIGYNGNQELKVKAENCMGVSGTRKKDIHKTNLPGTPGHISGPTSVCKSQTIAYSVGSASGASSYYWVVSGGAVIVTGQGTKNILVNFSSSDSSSVILKVVAVNSCGSSQASTIVININSNCKTIEANGNKSVTVQDIELNAYPNPSSGIITLSMNSNVEEKVRILVHDMLGKIVYESNSTLIQGHNSIELNLTDLPKGIFMISTTGSASEGNSIRVLLQ